MPPSIPQPRAWPIVGNIFDVDPDRGTESLDHLADRYGEIYKLNFFGADVYVLSSVELAAAACDESRFCKKIEDALLELRDGVGDGLFTAHHGEPNWGVAHRTLLPAFGPLSIKDMFDGMVDIANQLVSKWARNDPDCEIDLTSDTTRLALDTIGLCAMDIRFNSFYHDDVHPFVHAMTGFLAEAGRRPTRTKIETILNPGYNKRYRKDIAVLKKTAQECINRRKAGAPKKDILDAMLNGVDPKTGTKLSDESIMNNMITFLVAGHETTSGLLAFTIYYLLRNPEALQKAQKEVDDVLRGRPPTFSHMSKLPYIEAALRESMRLSPPAPGFTTAPLPGTKSGVVLKGDYVIPPNASLLVLLTKTGRDPAVFGEDANEFRPERMLDKHFRELPNGAFKVFGSGARACIGRSFSWQEATLTLALILQNFNLRLADPGYQMKVEHTLTQKPKGLFVKASLRGSADAIALQKKLHGNASTSPLVRTGQLTVGIGKSDMEGTASLMSILFGSTSGTCESLAQSLAASARTWGWDPTVQSLDAVVEQFPTDRPVIVISCTYEGQPPDNAKLFVQWLKTASATTISGAKVAVFGCGHRDWVSTYQHMPETIERELLCRGATALVARGETDVSQGTIFDDFEGWCEGLRKALPTRESPPAAPERLELQVSTTSRASHLHYKVQEAKVLSNDRITSTKTAEKWHLVLQLPSGLQYEVGDYLAILPMNHRSVVSRVLRRFGLPWDATLTLTSGSHATIPTDHELPVFTVLSAYVELTTPATRKNKDLIAQYAEGPLEDSHGSVLEILERYPSIRIPFADFISMLPSLRLRQYSISSSPLSSPTTASITYSVIEHDGHVGASSSYLRDLQPDSTLQVAVKKSSAAFRLPLDDSTPIIMVCAGAGIAPFRGFIQERALKAESGRTLGEAVLFVGCRSPTQDKLFEAELTKWEEQGVVKVFYAYSRETAQSEGCRYVQDRLWHERKRLAHLFDAGARSYLCGSSAIGRAVTEVAAKIVKVFKEEDDGEVLTLEEAGKWFESLRGVRYAIDVFD